MNIKKYLTLIFIYLISFNVYSTNFFYPTLSDAYTACLVINSKCVLGIHSNVSSCGGSGSADLYQKSYYSAEIGGYVTHNYYSCITSPCTGVVQDVNGSCSSPCDSNDPKLVKTTDILNLFPSHQDSEGCWWSPDHSTMTVTATDNCDRNGCLTEGYFTFNSSSSEPPDGDPNFTPPDESFVDDVPPPVVNSNSNVDDTVVDSTTTTVMEDGTAISTSTTTERSLNVDTSITDTVTDVTVTNTKSPEVVKTTTETVISNVDNSSTVTNVTNTVVNSSSTSSTTYNKDGSEPNSTATQSVELSNSTTTITSNYDGDGRYSGGESSTTDPEPDDPNEPTYKSPKKTNNFNASIKSENEAIVKAKENLSSKITDIQQEINTMFDLDVSGSTGSLPCPPAVAIDGFGSFDFCVDEYEPELLNIKYILLFVATFLALAIILR